MGSFPSDSIDMELYRQDQHRDRSRCSLFERQALNLNMIFFMSKTSHSYNLD